jgi:hypothetical protein
MKIINQRDFWAGALFLAFGAYFASQGAQYTFGTASRMGPGYFPTLLGGVLMLLGTLVSAGALSHRAAPEKLERFNLPTMLLILGPVVLFGLLLEPLGLVLSLAMLVVVSSIASHEFNLKGALFNAAFMIGLCLLVFVYALDLRFQLWPAAFGA